MFRPAKLNHAARVSMATAAAADFRAHFVSVQNAARAADPTAPLLTGEELMENADDSATDEIVTKWVASYSFPDVMSNGSSANLVVSRPSVAQVVRDMAPHERVSIMALESLKSAAAARIKAQKADKTYEPTPSEMESALESTTCDESDAAASAVATRATVKGLNYMSAPLSPTAATRRGAVRRPRYQPGGLFSSEENEDGDGDEAGLRKAKRARHASRSSRKAQALKYASRLERRHVVRARHPPTVAAAVATVTSSSGAVSDLMPPPLTVPKLKLSVPRLVYTSSSEDEATTSATSATSGSVEAVVAPTVRHGCNTKRTKRKHPIGVRITTEDVRASEEAAGLSPSTSAIVNDEPTVKHTKRGASKLESMKAQMKASSVVVISDSESEDENNEIAVVAIPAKRVHVTGTPHPLRSAPVQQQKRDDAIIDITIDAVIAGTTATTDESTTEVAAPEATDAASTSTAVATEIIAVPQTPRSIALTTPFPTNAGDGDKTARRAFLSDLRASSKKNAERSVQMDTDAERAASRSLGACNVTSYIKDACMSTRTAPTTDYDSDALVNAMNLTAEVISQRRAERMARRALRDTARPEADRRQFLRATRIPQSNYATPPTLRRAHLARCKQNAANNTCSICRRDLDATLITSFIGKAVHAVERLADPATGVAARELINQYMVGSGKPLTTAEKEVYDRRQVELSDVPSITQCCVLPLCGSCIRAWVVNYELHTTCLVKNRGRLLDRLPRCVVCNVHGKDTAMIGSADVAAACETSLSMRALRHLEFRGINGAKCAYVVRAAITDGH